MSLGTPRQPTGAEFDALLAGHTTTWVRDDGEVLILEPGRWQASAGHDDGWLLDRCCGPTLDLGCGPGRLVAALRERGVRALGVDTSPTAHRLCRRRGVPMIRRNLFAPLPGEEGWSHVLLADGNIGIGGDPLRLLRRAAGLVAPGGTVLVEVAPQDRELWLGTVRSCTICCPAHGSSAETGGRSGPALGGLADSWIAGLGKSRTGGSIVQNVGPHVCHACRACPPVPWACVGAAALHPFAEAAGLRVGMDSGPTAAGRRFLQLHRPCAAAA